MVPSGLTLRIQFTHLTASQGSPTTRFSFSSPLIKAPSSCPLLGLMMKSYIY